LIAVLSSRVEPFSFFRKGYGDKALEKLAVENDNWLSKVYEKYLKLYVAEIDWERHRNILANRYVARNHMPKDEAVEKLRKVIACTTLLPVYDKQKIPDPPENLFYQCASFHQFEERDWYGLLHETYLKDQKISRWRNQCKSMGIVDPIDYSPITRQAFNWLFGSALDAGDITDANKQRIEQSFKRLIYAYGGASICSVYQKHAPLVKKTVINWRSNYFFEKTMFEVYSIDQLVKIKRQELKKTNPRLIKKINNIS